MINPGIKNMIENNALGLATSDKDGNPHNIAVGYLKVISKNEIIILDNYLNETVRNIKINLNVALVVWAENWKENCVGYELKGKAEYFTAGKWIEFIKNIPENNEEPCKDAILITLNEIKVLKSPKPSVLYPRLKSWVCCGFGETELKPVSLETDCTLKYAVCFCSI